MAKRILIFSLNYYPFVGGAEVAIKEITDRIAPEDIEFHLIAYRFDSSLLKVERIGNVVVHRVGFGKRGTTVGQTFHPLAYLGKILYVPLAAFSAWRITRAERIDAYWAMMSYMLFPIVLLRLLGMKRPYVLTLQEGDPYERVFERRRIRAVAPLLRSGFRHAANVQAISTFLLTWAKQEGFQGEGEVVPNGVDTARFARDYSVADITPMREHLGAKAGDILLVTTSRLVHKNGIDTVIRSLVLMPPQVSFLIYGSGPDEEKLRALAAELGVSDRARFMGQASHDELPLILSACDIFVRPSRSEGMGNSFIEAMAAGLPVIATQEGGIADFLFDAKRNPGQPATGWAVDSDSPEQIARAADDILMHSGVRKVVTEAARRMALEKYDWNLIAGSMRQLFDGLPVRATASEYTRSRRLVVATPLYPPELGGPATYARLLENGLPQQGIQTTLVKFGDVRRYPTFVRHVVYFWKIFLAARKGDVLLALDPVSVGLPALVAARLRRAAFLVKIVGDYAWEQGVQRFGVTDTLDRFVEREHVPWQVALLRFVQRRVAKSARIVIVPSEYLKRIVSTWDVQPNCIQVVYNAIELEEEGVVSQGVEELSRPIIATVGRLVPWKRVGGIIDAAASLPPSSPASLVVVGDGPNRTMLTRQAGRQLGDKALFTGALGHADTLAVVHAADVFVLNSTYEGLSHVLIEALMLGKPVIATDVGGNGELITDGENGLLVPPNDTKTLTDALAHLLGDAALRERFAKNARAAREQFSVGRMIARTADVLRSV